MVTVLESVVLPESMPSSGVALQTTSSPRVQLLSSRVSSLWDRLLPLTVQDRVVDTLSLSASVAVSGVQVRESPS